MALMSISFITASAKTNASIFSVDTIMILFLLLMLGLVVIVMRGIVRSDF